MSSSWQKFGYAALAASIVGVSNVQAGTLALSNTPLFLTNSVEPNIFFLLDDSGSMDWEILLAGTTAQGLGTGIESGYYILPSPGNDRGVDFGYSPSVNRDVVPNESAFPGNGLWRIRNHNYNALYYNPAIRYLPWSGKDSSGNPFTDADPTAAESDPVISEGTLDLTSNFTFWNYYGGWYQETVYPAAYYKWDKSSVDDTTVDVAEIGDRVEIRAGGEFDGGPDRSDCDDLAAAPGKCSYAEEIQNFANWYQYYRKRNYLARGAIGAVIDEQSAVRSGIYVYNNALRQSVISLSSTTNKQTMFNSLYGTSFPCSTGSCPGTPARNAMKGLGDYFSGSSSPILSASAGGKCQQNFQIVVTDGYWNGGNPSVGNEDGGPEAALTGDSDWDGGYFADAYSNSLADVAMKYYETDLKTYDNRVPISDVSIKLARKDFCKTNPDDATCFMHQHLVTYSVAFGVLGTLNPLDYDFTTTFPTWPSVSGNTRETVDDLFHAAVNGRGAFFSAQDPVDLVEDLSDVINSIADRTASSSSVALSSGFLNSESLLFQARFDSSSWGGQLIAFGIDNTGSGTTGDVTAPAWDAGCKLTGGLCASDGKNYGSAPDWESDREIITAKPSVQRTPSSSPGIAFRWPADPLNPSALELDEDQTDSLSYNFDINADDALGEDRLEFIRGRNVDGMRSRSSILGDIINSNPLFVGPPSYRYPDGFESEAYSEFADDYKSRDPIIYVGANDGMFHGFEATIGKSTSGKERIAFVPSKVFENLSTLTSKNYGIDPAHRAFVDASATAGDVFYSNNWRTVVVGALGKGGQGIFALDVTDPSDFDESNASDIVRWEFTNADDADLGYTYGQPAIVRLKNGKWAAVVGNGYNNIEEAAPGNPGNAVLFLLDIEDGSVIQKFNTGYGIAEDPKGDARPNGMAAPSPVDLDGDYIVDYIYAPDLFGNVWKIDVRDASASNWKFAFESGPGGTESDTNKKPFFVAKTASGDRLPISSRVEVGLHPSFPGQMVYFGTGQYIETGDDSAINQDTQTFFGIWDRNESAGPSDISRGHLEPQAILEELPFSGSGADDVRRTSAQIFAWHTGTGLPAQNLSATTLVTDPPRLGWHMDLVNTEGGNTNNRGERVVSDPVLRDGKIIFVTVLPVDDPCLFGGDSWLMEVSATTGSRLETSPFDLNGDGVFSLDDQISAVSGGGTEPVGGVKSGVGIMPAPGILRDDTAEVPREFKYFSGSSGNIQKVTEDRGTSLIGRQSWREIYGN